MPRSLSMPFWRAKMVAQAVLPHVSNDDVTPVLTLAVVRGDSMIATDRYSVGCMLLQEPKPKEFDKWSDDQRKGWEDHNTVRQEGELDADDPTWADDFPIPRDALSRISTLSKAQTIHGLWPESRIVIREEFGEWKRSTSPRIVRDDPTARSRDRRVVVEVLDPSGLVEFGLMGSNLSKIIRFAGKHTPFKITAGAPKTPDAVRASDKLAPMLVEVGDDFRALIQPTLILQ